MARKRAAAVTVDYRAYGDSNDDSHGADSDYEPRPVDPQERKHRRKSPKTQQQPPPLGLTRARRTPSLVTPEQIIANAAAAAAKHASSSAEQQSHRHRGHGERSATARSSSVSVKSEQTRPETNARTERHHRPYQDSDQLISIKNEDDDGNDDDEDDEVEDNDNGDEDDGDDDEPAAPVVFQCDTCRSIFGDSYALVGSSAELLLLTLSAATNVTPSTDAQTSRDGLDAGSSFHELLCSQCQTVLGRQYVTTPSALDALRGLFSFMTTAIASYQLGYPQLQRRFSASASANANSAVAVSGVGVSVSDHSVSIEALERATSACQVAATALTNDRAELLQLRADMTKVQSLLLVVDERLHHLEDSHELVESDSERR